MNKQELVDAIAGDSGLSKADAKRAGKKRMDINSFLNGVKLDDTYKCV